MLPTYFISHGGGPWPYMKDQMPGVYDELESFLKKLPKQLPETPKAILAISGHWETREFTVMSSTHPPMIYDYSGFPEHTYHIKYSAPGSPDLAQRVQKLLQEAGFPKTSWQKRWCGGPPSASCSERASIHSLIAIRIQSCMCLKWTTLPHRNGSVIAFIKVTSPFRIL